VIGKNNFISKIANTDFPIHDLIARRWSARVISSQKVEKKQNYFLFLKAQDGLLLHVINNHGVT